MPSRSLLVPALAFGATLAGAVTLSAVAGRSPEAALFGRAVDYVNALQRGDHETVARLRLDGDPRAVATWMGAGRWRLGIVLALEVARDGRVGRVEVGWLDPGNRPGLVETQIWRRAGGGPWRLEASGPGDRLRR